MNMSQQWIKAYNEAYNELIADGCPKDIAESEAVYAANDICGLIITQSVECDIY